MPIKKFRRRSIANRDGGSGDNKDNNNSSNANTSSIICAICCEDTAAAAEVARPSVCQHVFCRGCLEKLCRAAARDGKPNSGGSSSKRLCPLDRKPFDTICVAPNAAAAATTGATESVLDAATLEPLKKIFDAPSTPAILLCALAAVLWLSPSWLLALHILALAAIYLRSDGREHWHLYNQYYMCLYCVLLPVCSIDLLAVGYAWTSCLLMMYFAQSMSVELASSLSSHAPEKALLFGTAALAGTVCPALLFSLYTLAQIYCYSLCLLLGSSLNGALYESLGRSYGRSCLLFVSLVFTPYACLQLEQFGLLLHLLYSGAVMAAWLLCLRATADSQQALPQELVNLPANVACSLAAAHGLGFSLGVAVYSLAIVFYATMMAQLWNAGKLRRASQLLCFNAAIVACLLPWKLFGLFTFLGCFLFLFVFITLIGYMLNCVDSMSNRQTLIVFYNSAVLGILVPQLLL